MQSGTNICGPVEGVSGCDRSDYASEEDEDSPSKKGSEERSALVEATELQQRRDANIAAMLTNR